MSLCASSAGSSGGGEPQGNWRWNLNFRDVVASSPSYSRPAARVPPPPRRACSQALPNSVFFHFTSSNKPLRLDSTKVKKIRISLIGGLDLTIVEICGRIFCDKSCKNSMELNDYCLFCFCSSVLYFPAILMPMQSAVITQIGRRT